jgi:alkanesulfonate monooxygenase SsuD/methylene tetrahydromethanopterin reductase-like flavin-dependent oxidoreductase (luciferase family)
MDGRDGATVRYMRFGIIDHNDDSGRRHVQQIEERLELVEAYDRLGFYAYHLTEHHGTPLAITGSPHLMLAAAASRTSRLRLGTLITILSLYHPMRLIEETVMLDQLTGGRLDLGVGRGVSPAELAFYGVSGEEEAQERFDEALEILRHGLTSDSVTFSGKHYTLSQAPVVSRPVQRPHPPLWYGTRTPSKARWCAQLGMPMMALVPSEAVRALTDVYRDEWASLGRSPDDLPPLGISRNMVLAPTRAEAMQIANRAFARFSRSLLYLWEKYDITPPAVFPADTFEGICATDHFYAGDPAGARSWVARHRDAGRISYMALETCFGDMSYDEALRTAELFAAEVMPCFSERLLDQPGLAEGIGHRAGRGRGRVATAATAGAATAGAATAVIAATAVVPTAGATTIAAVISAPWPSALPIAPAGTAATPTLTAAGLAVPAAAVGGTPVAVASSGRRRRPAPVRSGRGLIVRVVIEPHGQGDALARDVDRHHLDPDDVARLGDVTRVGDKAARHGRHVHQAILMHADVDERAERRDVGDDTLEHHARLEVLDLVDALGEGGGLELRPRVTARLLQLAQDVGDGRQASGVVDEVLRPQPPQHRRVADEARHVRACHREDPLHHRVGLGVHA